MSEPAKAVSPVGTSSTSRTSGATTTIPKKAQHHGRDAGQHLDHRLEDLAQPVGRNLADKDRRRQAQGQGDDDRPGRHQQRAQDERQSAKKLLVGVPGLAK